MNEPKLYVASLDEIKRGLATDIYFERTKRILEEHGLCDKIVRAELHAYSLPKGYKWGIYAGLEEALALLASRKITVYSMPEGTLFRPIQPLMLIEGPYCEFATLETALLGILRHESSIATKAARIRLAAGDKTVLFFGLRSLHPALAPMADRAAYIGGVDGVSGALSEKYLGLRPQGTMPHALIIVFGDPVAAWKAFDKSIEEGVPRIALVDTFYDERYEALLAAKTLKEKLYGVRLDTPSSRKGNFRRIVEEVRWTLDLHGYKNVKIFVSGGLDEENIPQLRDIVDGFGVGTSIAFPPSIDISMDIVEVYEDGVWKPLTKRGKLPGAKQVYRCNINEDYITPLNSNPPRCLKGEPRPLLIEYLKNGELVRSLPSIQEIREYVLKQLQELREESH